MKNKVMEQLVKFRINHHKHYSAEELKILADDWIELITRKHISIDIFIEACILHREVSVFFPTFKDIYDRCVDVWNERRRNIKSLPEPIPDLSPDQIKENAARARAVIKQMNCKGG